jgi:hypothetical protein
MADYRPSDVPSYADEERNASKKAKTQTEKTKKKRTQDASARPSALSNHQSRLRTCRCDGGLQLDRCDSECCTDSEVLARMCWVPSGLRYGRGCSFGRLEWCGGTGACVSRSGSAPTGGLRGGVGCIACRVDAASNVEDNLQAIVIRWSESGFTQPATGIILRINLILTHQHGTTVISSALVFVSINHERTHCVSLRRVVAQFAEKDPGTRVCANISGSWKPMTSHMLPDAMHCARSMLTNSRSLRRRDWSD